MAELKPTAALKRFMIMPEKWREDYPDMKAAELVTLKKADPEGYAHLAELAMQFFRDNPSRLPEGYTLP